MRRAYTARYKNGRQYKIEPKNVRKVNQIANIIRNDIYSGGTFKEPEEIDNILDHVIEGIHIAQEELAGVDFTG